MIEIHLSLLRGICQLPAYVAHAKGFFLEQGLVAHISISPSAWLIPEQLCSGTADFAVIPWTRVAAAEKNEAPLKVVCGSGFEEACGARWPSARGDLFRSSSARRRDEGFNNYGSARQSRLEP